MQPYRLSLLILVLTYITITPSCKKEAVSNEKSFVSFVDTETDYFTRSCFQLNDGNYFIVGTGENKSVIAKFTSSGEFIWKKDLPGTLFGVKKGMPLPSGGFVLAGFDSTYRSITTANRITTISLFDNNGNETKSVTINVNPSSLSLYYHIDYILLENGNLAFCISQTGADDYAYPRLLVLDQNLTTIFDQVYYDGAGLPFKGLLMPHIQEGLDGSIYFCYSYNNGTDKTTALMKLKAVDYTFEYLRTNIGYGDSEIPASFAIDENGNCCMASSRQSNPSQQFVSYFYKEEFSLGNEVSVIRTDTSGIYIDRHNYSGYPLLGSLMKILKTKDGGFIMVGTSNQNTAFSIASKTQIFLIKTDANLNKQWMKQFNSPYPAVGYDVFETMDGGYAIGAFQKSFNNYFKMTIIKTDGYGN